MASTPTFNGLMAEGATPRRTPILDTNAVTTAVVEWFQNKAKWRMVETEMALPAKPAETQRRGDVIAWNREDQEFYIVEVKTQWNDFLRDRKFFDYRRWCNWFAFAVPEELAACAKKRMDAIDGWYKGVGLLVIPNDFGNRRMVRRPVKNDMPHADYVTMLERWGQSCWGRLLGLRQDKAGLAYDVKNLTSDNTQLRKNLRRLGEPNPTLYPQPQDEID